MFSVPAPFTFGNVGRVLPDLRGPGQHGEDLSLFKAYRVRESMKLTFRAEAFNAFNHPIWAAPGTSFNNAGTFGVIQTNPSNYTRNMQLALRLDF